MHIRQLTLLRAHLLTLERAEQLAALRRHTGIQLVLLAHPADDTATRRLLTLLAAADLTDHLQQRTGTQPAIDFFAPPSPRQPAATAGRYPPDRTTAPPELPATGVTRFRADLRRYLHPTDFKHADRHYRAALWRMAPKGWFRRGELSGCRRWGGQRWWEAPGGEFSQRGGMGKTHSLCG
ncbi:hypothetical protein [Streptomyces rimosus]|uniref:hypothetical protein n=1 Tax=Streptomyces rimosus TaxID=1927 RepID=UPI000B22E834|nr:hypothetical protein [Streptomyces rimosus]